jgi:peptidoglycan/LPS O-acetylase OafA/YrhL
MGWGAAAIALIVFLLKIYWEGALALVSSNRLAGLDTLRSIAILAVIVCHLDWALPGVFAPVVKPGWMGVDLFFVLSGYLIGSQLLRSLRRSQGLSIFGFYRSRAYRILPVYWAVLVLFGLWNIIHPNPGKAPLWQFLTFTENLFYKNAMDHQFDHVWSLCVEEHFYLLLPILVLWLARRPALWKTATALAVFLLAGIGLRGYELLHDLRHLPPGSEQFLGRYYERIYYPTYTRLDGLLAGVTLALVRTYRPVWWVAILRNAGCLAAAGCALVGCAVWMFADSKHTAAGVAGVGTVLGFTVLALGLALLVAVGSDTGTLLGRMRVPGARLVATLAYSLYLTHREVARVDALYLPRIMGYRDGRTMLLLAVSCLAVAGAMYLCVERPFLMLRDRRGQRGRQNVDVEARAEPAL